MDNKNVEEEEVEEIKEEEDDLKRDVGKKSTSSKDRNKTDPPKNVSTPASHASKLDERINTKIRGAPAATKPGAVPTSRKPTSKSATATATATAAVVTAAGAVHSTENPTLGKASGRTPTATATVGAVRSTEGSQTGKSRGRTAEDSAQARQQALKRVEKNLQVGGGDAEMKAAKDAVQIAPVVDVSSNVNEKASLRQQQHVEEDFGIHQNQSDHQLSAEDQVLYAQQSMHLSAHVDPEVQSVNTYPMPSTMAPDVESESFTDNHVEQGDVIQAYVPEEVVSAIGVEVLEDDTKIIEEEKKKARSRAVMIAVCLVIVCVSVVVPVSLTVFKKTETQVEIVPVTPTAVPSTMPSVSPSLTPSKADEPLAIAKIRDYVKTDAPDLLSDTSDVTLDAYIQLYQVTGTPHNRALKWILYEDTLDRPYTDNLWMQRLSLAILYFSMTEDGPWTDCGQYDDGLCILDTTNTGKKNFLNGVNECDWFSIQCKDDIVIGINNIIGGNNVRGQFPDEIGLLTELKRLWWQEQRVHGSIPESWKMLKNLDTLGVARNELTGPWPSIVLEKTPLLSTLFLFQNNFTGPIGSSISLLSNLLWLKADNNNFNSLLPGSIGDLSKLTTLELHENQFSLTIPTEFGKLKKLEILKLNDNKLEGEFPKMLTTLPKLRTLHLNRNQFRLSLPPSIGSIGNETMQKKLKFELQNNDFSGKIPPELGRIDSLVTLDLRNNTFEGEVPTALCEKTGDGPVDLSALSVDCGEVECSCCSPSCFPKALLGMLTSEPADIDLNDLKYWKPKPHMSSTLSRSYPNQAIDWYVHEDTHNSPNVNHLQRITLAMFYFATSGTNWITQKGFLRPINECDWDGITCVDGNVTEIIIESNGLKGYLPKELKSLPSLEVLKLGNNSLMGEIPRDLGSLEKLKTLHLDNNDFVNNLPNAICDANKGQDKSILVDCNEVTCASGCCDGC